ncbi:hypothetical protein TSAR_005690, partial [Trichomalopsis sarcophagae]
MTTLGCLAYAEASTADPSEHCCAECICASCLSSVVPLSRGLMRVGGMPRPGNRRAYMPSKALLLFGEYGSVKSPRYELLRKLSFMNILDHYDVKTQSYTNVIGSLVTTVDSSVRHPMVTLPQTRKVSVRMFGSGDAMSHIGTESTLLW